ncbi:mas-related G-protein coupled receptor member A2B-like [Anas platyrhynchos]|uniref:G-protein coupled receptors family 1 profile domain-containing protein n=1 Tax=Anas platyrhynchos platyrhynchos TaxID=8840 RepID=U3HYS9_ANAPP|nr:mas-related G-protein coupled receptor member A2-like [Anas platyrhynchos]XP_038036327.1 mas-related G-protein coupled receptor member A2-like [Anas platyrhynchos]|eukprot:XP_005028448.2 mas-related G-protein coupled receptor member A2-like [Anas platyrhynchos]
MSAPFPTTARYSPACWSWPSGMAHDEAWHRGLMRQAASREDDYNWTDCEADSLSEVPATLLICLCGLVGNGAVLWLLGSHIRRNPITVYVFSLAIADFTFLLSIAIALVMFYGPLSFCHRLGSRDVMAMLNIIIIFVFTTSIYLLAAFGASTSLSALCQACWPRYRSWHLPALVCALLWALSFLLTVTLYFSPVALVIFVLSYLLSVLILILSSLTLFAKVLCCSWQHPLRKLCVVVLLVVISFLFFNAGFPYWLLLRLFDFSVLFFDTPLLFACVSSSINPIIYFLAGSCTKKFPVSARLACQRAFEDVMEPENRSETPRESSVEINV